VIGAGISGLTAARTLKDANIDVIVLEAAEEIGGRTLSFQYPDYLVNYGAEFICKLNNPDGMSTVLKKVILESGLKLYRPDWDEILVYDKCGQIFPNEVMLEQRRIFLEACDWVINQGVSDRSFIEQIKERYPDFEKSNWMQYFIG
jgi:choline dehydrogenase-like flavoprotein